MCGPADFDALHTCIIRIGELAACGLASYAVHKTAVFSQKPGKERDPRKETTTRDGLADLAPDEASGTARS